MLRDGLLAAEGRDSNAHLRTHPSSLTGKILAVDIDEVKVATGVTLGALWLCKIDEYGDSAREGCAVVNG